MAGILERIEEWKKLQGEDLGPAGIRRGRERALKIARCEICGVPISVFPERNLSLFDDKPHPPAQVLCEECFEDVQTEIRAKHDEPDGETDDDPFDEDYYDDDDGD